MMNDKIRLAAEALALLGGGVSDNTYAIALAQPQRDEHLRIAFLADVKKQGLQEAMKTFLTGVRIAFDKSEGRLEDESKAMLQMLEDEEVITPADRAAAAPWMTNGEANNAMAYPYLLASIEKIWQPTYDKRDGFFHWMRALQEDSTVEVAKRLAARTDVDSVPVSNLAEYAKSLPALDVLVSRMSPSALAREVDKVMEKVLGQIESKSVPSATMESSLLVMLARLAESGRADMEKGFKFFRSVLVRIEHREEAVPYLARFAQLAGRLDDPEFFKAMSRGVLKRIEPSQLAGLLKAGLPTSLDLPGDQHREAGLRHLLVGADLEQVLVIGACMSKPEKEDFVRRELARKVSKASWGGDVKSCLEENWLTALHAQGFDLGVVLPGGEDGDARLHNAPGVYFNGSASDFTFTALHALGVYPSDLRWRGSSPVTYAAVHDDERVIRALAALGYDLDDPEGGERPIVSAVKFQSKAALRALIELGADVGVKASSGASLLQLAKDDELKRVLRAARTGASVERAMAGSQESKKKLESRSDPGVL